MKLASVFEVMARRGPSSADDLASLSERFPIVPHDYLRLMRKNSELELGFGDHGYLRIWAPSGCIEMDDAYGFSHRLPGAFPLGDDGGGLTLCYWKGPHGIGLYRVHFDEITPERAVWVAQSLADLLESGDGLERLDLAWNEPDSVQ